MGKLLIKELVLGLFFLGVGLYLFHSFEVSISKDWVVLSLIITLFMMAGTWLVKFLLDIGYSLPGLALVGFTLFGQFFLLLLLFIFLEPENTNHRIMAKSGTISYSVYLGIDIYWKISWMFPPKKRKRMIEKENEDF